MCSAKWSRTWWNDTHCNISWVWARQEEILSDWWLENSHTNLRSWKRRIRMLNDRTSSTICKNGIIIWQQKSKLMKKLLLDSTKCKEIAKKSDCLLKLVRNHFHLSSNGTPILINLKGSYRFSSNQRWTNSAFDVFIEGRFIMQVMFIFHSFSVQNLIQFHF